MQVVEHVCDKCNMPAHVLFFSSRGKGKHDRLVLCCNFQCPNNSVVEALITAGVNYVEGTNSN